MPSQKHPESESPAAQREPAAPSAGSVVPYSPARVGESLFIEARGLRHHVRRWSAEGPATQTVILLHGWMDCSASFQFVVDCLPASWNLLAPDWRGFGLSERSGADCYWFPDYLADLDALLDALVPEGTVDLVAHSMGGNIATLYAGVRPSRVRRLVNLEGVGLPETRADQAPERYRDWLDELKAGARLADYPSREAVAARLMKNNPRLRAEQAAFLALHWGVETPQGRFALAADPAHRLVNPVLYRLEEVLAVWRQIEAQVLWVLSEHAGSWHAFVREPAYRERLAAIRRLRETTIAGAGHMMHHDQPEALARLIEEFFR